MTRKHLWEVEITWKAIAYAWATTKAGAGSMINTLEMLDCAEEEYIDAEPVISPPASSYDPCQVYSDDDEDLTVAEAWARQEAQRIDDEQQAVADALQGKLL